MYVFLPIWFLNVGENVMESIVLSCCHLMLFLFVYRHKQEPHDCYLGRLLIKQDLFFPMTVYAQLSVNPVYGAWSR